MEARRHWDVGQGTGEAVAEAATARGKQDAPRPGPTKEQPVRIAAGVIAGALGQAGDGG